MMKGNFILKALIRIFVFGFLSLLLKSNIDYFATLVGRRHVFAVSSEDYYHFYGQVCLLLCLGKLFIDRIQLFMLPNAFILLFLFLGLVVYLLACLFVCLFM